MFWFSRFVSVKNEREGREGHYITLSQCLEFKDGGDGNNDLLSVEPSSSGKSSFAYRALVWSF